MELAPLAAEPPISAWSERSSGLGPACTSLQMQVLEQLHKAFESPFAVFDAETGELNQVIAGWLRIDVSKWHALLEEIARRGRAELIEDCAPLAVLAVPLPSRDLGISRQVGLTTLLTEPCGSVEDVAAAAEAVGVDADALLRWGRAQRVWPTFAVEQLSRSLVRQAVSETDNSKLKRQLTNVSQQLLQTFDELNLLHRINEKLCLSISEQELLELTVEWLSGVLPAECLLACVEPEVACDTEGARPTREWIYAGDCPLAVDELDQFLDRLGPDVYDTTVIVDGEISSNPTWFYPSIREAISVPIRSRNVVSGWLVALNRKADTHQECQEFGRLETSLLSSVASMLGMHSGNVRLFKDQARFFESVIRAFSSAIDAKDPYTRGHSERVARIAVLIARRLGASKKVLNSVYLSGLLHDIGKIGINDEILRKPGALTAEEYDYIKLHPNLGYEILKGVRQLEDVLPVVLHHHEAWDGSGYPGGLVGEEIPWLARIVSVADAFDAMSSDRPYRVGMPSHELDQIFRQKSGAQWDPQVIEAFFAVRDEIDAVIKEDRKPWSLDVGQWQA